MPVAARLQKQTNSALIERTRRRERLFKTAIITVTVLAAAALYGGTSVGRFYVVLWTSRAREVLTRGLFGIEPTAPRSMLSGNSAESAAS